MFLSIFAMVSGSIFALYSCNKDDDETLDPSYQEPQNGKLLAVTDNNTGRTTYHFDIEKMNMLLNEKLTSKTSSDRYVVESMTIIDTMPLVKDFNPEIKIVLLDTDEEVTYSTWLTGFYTNKVITGQKTSYYLSSDVAAKNYEFAFYENDQLFVACVNGLNYSVERRDSALYAPYRPKWSFTCKATNCLIGECEKVYTGLGDHHYTCSPCTLPGSKCERVGIVEILIDIINAIGSIVN